jgi:hypothetical protein
MKMTNVINTKTRKWHHVKLKYDKKRGWLCSFCGNETQIIYIVTGHDHTDSSADMCTCGEGIPFEDVLEENRYSRYPLSYYEEYLK